MIKLLHILTLVATLSAGYLFSQCPRPSKVITPDYKNGWGENSQSKSGQLRPGDEYEMRFIAQPGIKYRIQAASGTEEFSKENINFQLVVKEVNRIEEAGKILYRSSEVILYDTKAASKDDEAIFVTPRTQRLSIKVKIDGVEDASGMAQCAIILIEAKKSPADGFH